MFLDEVTVVAAGGNGGSGCVAWHREKYVDRGGPDGGDGGNGGDVVVMGNANSDTLSEYMSRKKFKATDGERGTGKNCAGAGAPEYILNVPPGTSVYKIEGSTKTLLADLKFHGDRIVVARGGRGGYGNTHFQTSTRQAPDFAELGEPGEKTTINMQLKLVADVGIIGFPSVGKSSLIAAVSKARPKIADYPFTTLIPNLGVVKVFDRDFVLCDIPGLIEGASEGKGLGHEFLRHIERCGVLVHLLDISRDDVVADYKAIRKELKAHSLTLAKKRELVILNKVDLVGGDATPWVSALKKAKIKVFASISAAAHMNTEELMKSMLPIVLEEKEKRIEPFEEGKDGTAVPVMKPHLESDKMGAFRIEKTDTTIVILGKRIEQFTKMTNFNNPGGRQRFRDVAVRVGLIRALEKEAKPGDDIYIGGIKVNDFLS